MPGMAIKKESPEEHGYSRIRVNLSASATSTAQSRIRSYSIPNAGALPTSGNLIAEQAEGLTAEDVLTRPEWRAHCSSSRPAFFRRATTWLSSAPLCDQHRHAQGDWLRNHLRRS